MISQYIIDFLIKSVEFLTKSFNNTLLLAKNGIMYTTPHFKQIITAFIQIIYKSMTTSVGYVKNLPKLLKN